jgi:ubiquinone/menaquinone biosynthesis C-methylase UbiE
VQGANLRVQGETVTDQEAWQVSGAAAEVYESCFVPAIFGQWAPRLVETARLSSGDRVLDGGCGTGVLARAAADRVAPEGQITGVDIHEGMLAVARQIRLVPQSRRGPNAGSLWERG